MVSQTKDVLIYRAWKLRVAVALLVIAGVMVAWTMYDQGRTNAVSDLSSLEAERERLHDRIETLDERNRELEKQVAVLERAQQIDRTAFGEMKKEHAGLKQKIQGLNEELAFYRGIMSPAEARTGLRLQDFSIVQVADTRQYHFSLVLTQVKKRHPLARGKVKLFIVGKQAGVLKRLSLAELIDAEKKTDSLAYRFRYFQSMEGVLNLPGEFEPATIKVQVMPSGKGAPKHPLEWTFNWPVISPAESGRDDHVG